jgi:hypothetical protein
MRKLAEFSPVAGLTTIMAMAGTPLMTIAPHRTLFVQGDIHAENARRS